MPVPLCTRSCVHYAVLVFCQAVSSSCSDLVRVLDISNLDNVASQR